MRLLSVVSLVLLLAACAPLSGPVGEGGLQVTRAENPRAKVHTELAAQYYALRNYGTALKELAIAQAADASYPPAFNMLGLVHAALGEDRQAEAFFRKAVTLSPNYAEAHNNYGQFLCQRGRYDEALARFEEALKNPLFAAPEAALANAGFCALAKGDVNSAEPYLRRALARAPNQRLALLGMAELHLKLNNPYGARVSLEKLKPQGDLDAAGLWLALRVERQLGNPTAEAAYARQLRERFPESRETRWLQMGDYQKFGGMT
jgi:type IV pilus assembly protein PilF